MRNNVLLFDIDGTLTKPRQVIDKQFYDYLINEIQPHFVIGLVGGSDLSKICEQMGPEFEVSQFDYIFAENGLVALKNGVEFATQSIDKYLGEENSQKFINYCLNYMSKLSLPVKRGTFIEYRTGLINICPIGRSVTREQRNHFEKFDAQHKVRETFVKALRNDLADLDLQYSIGGQISFDVFPRGWDKRFCLQFIEEEFKNKIHFFGDKTFEGGNDWEIYNDSRVIPHSVTSPDDTKLMLNELATKYVK